MKTITFTARDLLERAREKLEKKEALYIENAFDDALQDMCRELGELHDAALRKIHEIEWLLPDEPHWEKAAEALRDKSRSESTLVGILVRARALNEGPPYMDVWTALTNAMADEESKLHELDEQAEDILKKSLAGWVDGEEHPNWDAALDKARERAR